MDSGSDIHSDRQGRSLVMFLAGFIVLLAVLGCLVTPTVSATSAPEEPRHGLDNETFHSLWSTTPNGVYPDANTTPEELRNTSDISFRQPPDAVETWNHNEYDRFPTTDDDVSVWPNGTETKTSPDTGGSHQNGWIKDGYIELFAVSPSTTLHRSSDDTITYIPRNGTVIAHADYRYDPPPPPYTITNEETRITYYSESSSIESTTVNGNSVPPTDTLYYNYTDLSTDETSITVTATFEASITKKTETLVCPEDDPCYWETTDVTTFTDELAVTDSLSATVYDPIITGFHSQLNDSTTDVEVGATDPWQGVELPSNESIHTNWRFYAGRDAAWDAMKVNSNPDDSPDFDLPSDPPAQPLKTHAYPSSYGSTADTKPFSETQLLNADGPDYTAPPLPPGVDLDTVNGSYNATAGFAFQSDLSSSDNLTAHGIVNGYTREIPVTVLDEQLYTNTTLNATITNQTNTHMTVAFNLTANHSGTPVDTSDTSGYIAIGGEQVDTNASGQAVATVPNAPMTAEYQPSPYYETFDPYRPSSTWVTPEPVIGGFIGVLNDLFTVMFLFGLFFLPLFILDRILDADVWPPWKGVWRELF